MQWFFRRENVYSATYEIGNNEWSYNPSYNAIMAAWSKVTAKKLFLSECVLRVLGSEVCQTQKVTEKTHFPRLFTEHLDIASKIGLIYVNYIPINKVKCIQLF